MLNNFIIIISKLFFLKGNVKAISSQMYFENHEKNTEKMNLTGINSKC